MKKNEMVTNISNNPFINDDEKSFHKYLVTLSKKRGYSYGDSRDNLLIKEFKFNRMNHI